MKTKKILSLLVAMVMTLSCVGITAMAEYAAVAKVGNTEYATIDEAIAAWTNGTTLTLLADVTLSDVVTLKSTEHHILNLGTYTMTAASNKNAFVIQACGNGSAERSTITINADATNPGGINAGNKCVVYYKYADGGISTEDRPIIKINGGIFTGSTSSFGTTGIYTIGTEARKCATLNISGGTFDCSIYGTGKSKLIISGGTFNYSVGSQGDSTALRLISGGTFKSFGFMTADSNNTKFWIGTSMGDSNVGAYIDDNGYLVVGGPVIEEAGENFEASSPNHSNAGFGSYLTYSSVATKGIYYTSVEEALADNNKANGSVTVYVEELDMTDINYKGTIVVPEGNTLSITNAPTGLKVTDATGKALDAVEVNGKLIYGDVPAPTYVAKIGDTGYASVAAAFDAAYNAGMKDVVITLIGDTAANTTDSINLYDNYDNGKAFNKVTICQEDASKPYYLKNLYTGWIGDKVVFDGVNIVVTTQFYAIGNVELTNDSKITRNNDTTNFVFYGDMYIQPGSKLESQVDRVNSGSSLTVDGGRTDGNHNNTADYKTIWLYVDDGNTMTIKNGAYVIVSNYEYAELKVSGTVDVQDSKLDVFTAIRIGANGVLKVNANSIVNTKEIIGTGKLTIDATGMPEGYIEALKNVKLSGFTGTIEVINNDYLEANIVDGKIVLVAKPVAKIGETTYETLEAAFKAANDGCTIDILDDVVIDYKWDCRDYATNGSHSQFKENVTINGNNHIIKFTGTISDSNWNTIFRFEENATVKNLTVDISEATGAQRVITAKKSLDVDNLTIVGSARYGIIFGEGATVADLADAEISIANSNLYGTRRAISDNEGGKDVKSVKITGNTLNADVCVSVLETVTFTGNNMTDGYVDIRSYTEGNTLDVVATGNTLTANTDSEYNYIEAGGTVDAQEGFVLPWDGVTISNLYELKMFRDAVNAGNNYAGKTVTLTDDIDLAGENWTPIGTIDAEHGFMGNFDGQNHKIMNLTITNPELDSDGYAYAGLFGITEGIDKDNQNFIKNLTIENVTINTTGHIVAAAIAYPYYTIVDNVKVCGKISISGGDYTAGVLAYTRRCIDASNLFVEGNTGSTISGKQVVGGVISDIQMNGGLTADYSNFNVSGVVISGTKNVGGISGIICEQKLIGGSVKDVKLSCDDARVGIVSGSLGAASVISNVTIENVTGASSIVGADYATGKVIEAKIGDKYYKTLTDALKANVDGKITLLAPIVVAAGETLELNKNVTITYTSNVPGEDMITNRGKVVIDGATLVYTNTDTTANNVTVSTISCEAGSTLEVKSGTVKNDSANNGGAGIYACAIDLLTNGNLGDVTATISGGKVISTNYMAIRQFNNGDACKNILDVTDGYIYGAKRAIQVHLKNDAAYTTISGGKIGAGEGGYALCLYPENATHLTVSGGEFIGSIYSGTYGFISGGTFDAEPYYEYAKEGYVFEKNADGTYSVQEAPVVAYVAQIGDTYYETFEAAIADAKDNDTIILIWEEGDAPIAMNGAVYGKSVTITGDATVDWSKGFLFVGRGGEGDGTVTFDNANLKSASNSFSYGIHVSGREKNTNNKYDGTVIIKDSTIELDYLINKGTMTLDNSTLTVKNGFSVGGRPASETESCEDATATMNLNNKSKVIVNNHNGMGLGYETLGVMNIDETSGFETTQKFLVTEKGTMNIAGTAKIAGTLTNNGTINLAGINATITAQEGLVVNSTVDGYEVNYADGKYSLKEIEEAKLFDFYTTTVTLNNSLAINFYVEDKNLSGENYVAKIEHRLADGTVNKVEVPYSEWGTGVAGYHSITYSGLVAKQMSEDVCITIYEDEKPVSKTRTDGLRAYAERALLKYADDVELSTALVDMLNYGAAAQEYFNYDVENLANATLSDEQKKFASTTENVKDIQIKGDHYLTTTLSLENNILLTGYFTFDSGIDGKYAEVKYNDSYGDEVSYTVSAKDFVKNTDEIYGVCVDTLAIADATSAVTITVYNADNTVYGTLVDSMESYLYRIMQKDNREIFKMIARFTASAYNTLHTN